MESLKADANVAISTPTPENFELLWLGGMFTAYPLNFLEFGCTSLSQTATIQMIGLKDEPQDSIGYPIHWASYPSGTLPVGHPSGLNDLGTPTGYAAEPRHFGPTSPR